MYTRACGIPHFALGCAGGYAPRGVYRIARANARFCCYVLFAYPRVHVCVAKERDAFFMPRYTISVVLSPSARIDFVFRIFCDAGIREMIKI